MGVQALPRSCLLEAELYNWGTVNIFDSVVQFMKLSYMHYYYFVNTKGRFPIVA